MVRAVFFTKKRFFNFPGWVTGNIRKNNFSWALVAWQSKAEFIDFFFRCRKSFLDLNNRGGDFAQTFIRKTDNRNIADFIAGADKIFNLNGIKIFSAR